MVAVVGSVPRYDAEWLAVAVEDLGMEGILKRGQVSNVTKIR